MRSTQYLDAETPSTRFSVAAFDMAVRREALTRLAAMRAMEEMVGEEIG